MKKNTMTITINSRLAHYCVEYAGETRNYFPCDADELKAVVDEARRNGATIVYRPGKDGMKEFDGEEDCAVIPRVYKELVSAITVFPGTKIRV